MTALRILETPELREPTLVAAFSGWSDAGAAATAAATYLIDRWHASPIAEIDAEQFYDFTQLRPTVRYEGEERRIDWPQNSFYYHKTEERDLIIFNGIEPHLKWKSYVETMLEVIERYKVGLFVSLGAMFVDFPHTRPMRVTGMAPTDEMAEKAGIAARRGGGRYQGPTGISGVLSATLRDKDLAMASIWANVPHYVSAVPNPTASLALLKSMQGMLSVEVPLGRMIRASAMFDRQLQEATSKNAEVSEYVRTLEERLDAQVLDEPEPAAEETAELPAAESILQDLEDFFKRPREGN